MLSGSVSHSNVTMQAAKPKVDPVVEKYDSEKTQDSQPGNSFATPIPGEADVQQEGVDKPDN